MTHTEKIESALSDYRNNHIYLDGAGNWRWKIGANGSRTVHPANNLLRGIGGYEEVNDAAHKHTVPEKRFNAVAGMLSAACNDSTVTQGDDSTVTQGYGSTATQGNWATVTQGKRSTATQGNGSVRVCTWWDGYRWRGCVAEIGDEGSFEPTPGAVRLDPGKTYLFESGKFTEVEK